MIYLQLPFGDTIFKKSERAMNSEHGQYWHMTQNEDKQNKTKKQYNIKKKETQQAKMMGKTDPIKNRVVLTKGKTPAVLSI